MLDIASSTCLSSRPSSISSLIICLFLVLEMTTRPWTSSPSSTVTFRRHFLQVHSTLSFMAGSSEGAEERYSRCADTHDGNRKIYHE